MRKNDSELLQCFVAERSEAAFAELVRRHIDFVFSAASRQTDGDRQLAEDVTQEVFSDLARKASRLKSHTSLVGWLYTSIRYAARSARRSDRRRQIREQQAFAMNQLLQPEPSLDWGRLRPMLDAAMHALNESDRQAVLLRFFHRLPLAEVGARLAVSENAARMRVDRALGKLRAHLEKRGFSSTAVVLGSLLSNYAVEGAPVGLAVKVTRGAVAAGATAGGGLAALLGMKGLLAGFAAVAILTTTLAVRHHIRVGGMATPAGVAAQGGPAMPSAAGGAAVARDAAATGLPAGAAIGPATGPVLTLRILNGKSDEALAGVQIGYRAWSDGLLDERTLPADSVGVARISYPADTTNLVLITEKEGYADTKLAWSPARGETIPETYTVHPDPAVPTAGKVVDEQGRPIAGATVRLSSLRNFNATASLSPESHTAERITVTTDADGRWQLARIAEEIMQRLEVGVTHPRYGAVYSQTGSEPAMERELRDGSFVITLNTTFAVTGTVVDAEGKPVTGAKILVGRLRQQDRREGTTLTDGSFVIDACAPGPNPVTAEADGLAAAAVVISVAANTPPVHLTMHPVQLLRLRVAAPDGTAIPGAEVGYDWTGTLRMLNENYPAPGSAQVYFSDKTGADGRVSWTNAPGGDLMFMVSAPGFKAIRNAAARADGEEHVITLTPSTLVTGTVRNAATRAAVPLFRVVQGFPDREPFRGRTNVHWINNRVQEFKNGAFSLDLARPLVMGVDKDEYVLRFEADDYEPFVSRIFESGEGKVPLDVVLYPSLQTVITVLKPDGQPAAGADVGLVSPGVDLELGPGSFIRKPLTTAVLHTEADGRFRLTTDPAVTRIIIACAEGYLSTTPDSLKGASTVRLEKWGRIDGVCFSGGKPVPGQIYKLALEDEEVGTVMCALQSYKAVSDADGRFTIQRAPPGRNNLRSVTAVPNGFSWGTRGQTAAPVRPGETTTIYLQP